MDSLVSTGWLAQHLDEVTVVDASWHMPATGRDARDEYLRAHIPGGRFLDIDALSDPSHAAPHMLPPARQFGEAMEALGIGRDSAIVVYDNSPLRTAARSWFMLRHFGAASVAILDGGFQKWTAEGRPTEQGAAEAPPAQFGTQHAVDRIVTKAEILAGADAPLLDARSKGRFEGSEADPRPGIAPGHIPGSANLPFAELYRGDGTFRSREELGRLFAEAGIDPQAPFVATCGSGITANSLIFAAQLLGNGATRLYDGSWSEWGADPATPKALGPA